MPRAHARSVAVWLNVTRTLAYLSPDAVQLGRNPFGSVVTCWGIRVPGHLAGAYQCRVICADGSLWSGRSTSGRLALTLYEMSSTGHTAQTIRRAFLEGPPHAP